ncbi:hypothetical protein DJ568_12710 [Mucilaginibacter hurinus]|uniref:MobA/VirD2-like nuclease domain-containing protein n=1 Tax=Mucilaginibacter hurinus TaxID=2201324 RepID=A0A367GMH9_9SPHI|nr:relaxase/mobilization nuclease domain-containing protein [Mucilaginibacter hurinus]RCH54674.1 hypothetical protein DJ568_12710 [Mucilaginibacter hurinus]
MVAKIKSGKSLIGALNYNEHKVKAGKARLIAAPLYHRDFSVLSFDEKLFRLTDLAERNQRTKTNTVHLSLNFDVSENLDEQRLCAIAERYMEKIGFGDQPFLVYEHFDAGHAHIHIVTTNIEADGNRISLHNIGKLRSEPARKEVESEFGLIRAESQHKSMVAEKDIVPLIYGDIDTKRAISNIINHVTRTYKFTSLPELNAILKTFNVQADRGAKDTTMFKKNGLRYWALDDQGNKTGVPFKASAIYKKPTLKLLEERFRLNEFLRKPYKKDLIAKIERILTRAKTRQELQTALSNQGVITLLRENEQRRLYGLTFVDIDNKVVFNGSDLGKGYSAASVDSRLLENSRKTTSALIKGPDAYRESPDQLMRAADGGLISDLLSPLEQAGEQNLFERRKKKKRKKLRI